jgi:hypothetical protein
MTRELIAFQDALMAQSVATRFMQTGGKVASVSKPLYGHDSPANAYVVEDYPYGFRLRCKIRYWVESNPSRGYRMFSQTTNPKIQGKEVWNKPKGTTFSRLAGCLYLDSSDKVQFAVLTEYSSAEECLEFMKDFPKFEGVKLLGIWAVKKLEFCYKMMTGKARFVINEVPQETSDSDKGRYRDEAAQWAKLAQKLGQKYPDFVDEELGI